MKAITTSNLRRIAQLFALFLLGLSQKPAIAQNPLDEIKSTFTVFDSAATNNQRAPLAAKFKLIAAQNPNDWLANYYAAYSIASLSFEEKDKQRQEAMLDDADSYFKRIESMASTNEEVSILGALLASARITARPSTYKKNGEIRDKFLATATNLNPNNPRIYYLQGNALFYTPKMFGGGAKKALPFFEKAAGLFANQDKTDVAKPYWGMQNNNYMLGLCKQQIK